MAAFAKPSQLHTPQRHHPIIPTIFLNTKFKTFTSTHNFKTHKLKHFRISNSSTATITSSIISSNNPNHDLCQLCLIRNLESAMSYLDTMHQLQLSVEEDSYTALVRLCEWTRARKEGSKVYSYVKKSMMMNHLSLKLGNALLSMFVGFGNLVDAWYVFGKMPERNLFSWNVLIGGYAKGGFFDEALDLYNRMLWVGVRPDVYTFPCVLKACGGVLDLVKGREVHVHVLRFGFESEVDVVNALITMYVKCGDVVTARLVFDKMINRDRISWNAMIAGHFENGECLEGLRLFCRMIEHPVQPDLKTLTSVITACELMGDERLGREIRGYVMRTHFILVKPSHAPMATFAKSSHLHTPQRHHHPIIPTNFISSKFKTFTSTHNFKTHRLKHFRISKSSTATITSSNSSNNPNYDLCQLCLIGKLENAMSYLETMHQLQISVEEDSYIALVRLCEWERAIKEGSKVYSYVKKSMMMTHLSLKLGNALLSMFVGFGNLVDAWYVFGKMPERDLFSWNVLIGGYAKGGFFDEALNLYDRMLRVGVRPDVYTFPCVLRTCGGVPDLVKGREVHVHVLRFGFESNVDVVNALISMYVKCGDVVTARLVFDKMNYRDRISWNAMIAGYFENGECLEGLRLFCRMIEYPVEPNLMTLTSVITACELMGDERLGREIHGYVMRTEFSRKPSVYNSLVQMYLSVGLVEEAEKVFSQTECRDVVSWTAMISGYEKNLMHQKALETYKMMEAEGVVPDKITIAVVLSACSCLCDLDMGTKLHEVAKKTGLIFYAIVSNSLVDMYAKCKCVDKALEVFNSIHNKDIKSWTTIILGLRINNRCFDALFFFKEMMRKQKPNSVTLVCVLSACARIGALTSGKEIHAHALRTGVSYDGFMPNAILDMYVRCGRMEYAWKQFFSCDQDVSTWTILLTGYAERRKGTLATELFRNMVESNVVPNEVTFSSLLCACSRSGMVVEGLEYFDSMKYKYSIKPNLKHYACMVDLLGRAGKLEEAYGFIQKMPKKPDPAVWGALLNACRIHRSVELGELAAQYIFQDDTTSVGYYILLLNLYADNNLWDKVAEVRKMMRQNGIIVDPGCSWVENKDTVHAFLSGDNFHPQIKEINALLERFYEKMKEAGIRRLESSRTDIMEASKADMFCGHSERLAITFGLINSAPGMPIRVTKNLSMCQSCHDTVKFISKEVRREISVRDAERFHHFKGGICSCMDEGY